MQHVLGNLRKQIMMYEKENYVRFNISEVVEVTNEKIINGKGNMIKKEILKKFKEECEYQVK